MDYTDFLQRKQKDSIQSGFEIDESYLHPILFPFQKYIVKRALSYGKYAIFSECGTGKTLMQLEWAKHVCSNTNQPVLILCPLAVSAQTIEEGLKLDIKVRRLTQDVTHGIYISNYEQIENIDASKFSGIVLDESSILKNFLTA